MKDDLFWILNCPSLMRMPKGITCGTQLIDSLITESHSITSQEAAHHKLGLYYEDCIEKLLKSSAYLTDYKRNILVKDTQRTIGEFDYIGRTCLGDFHLECAVKFYLRVGNGLELSHFIGPGKRDRLDIKWQRMIEHQINLSLSDPGRSKCEALGLIPKYRAILIQGYLFHPWDGYTEDTSLHQDINPTHLRGWWLKADSIELLYADEGKVDSYQILKKPYWLAYSRNGRSTLTEIKTTVKHIQSPILLRRLDENGHEIDRGFVVNSEW